jgi:hypothetical protein
MGLPFRCQQSVVSGERRTVGVRRFFPMVAVHPRIEADRLGIPIGGSRGTGYKNGGEKNPPPQKANVVIYEAATPSNSHKSE